VRFWWGVPTLLVPGRRLRGADLRGDRTPHEPLKKVTEDLEAFRFNIALARLLWSTPNYLLAVKKGLVRTSGG